MDAAKLLLEVGLVIWLVVVGRRVGWATPHPRLLWGITAAAAVTNIAITYLGILPSPAIAQALETMSPTTLHAFLAFGILKWVGLVYLTTRVALVVTAGHPDGGFAFLRVEGKEEVGSSLRKSALVGVGYGLLATAFVYGFSFAYLHFAQSGPLSHFAEYGIDFKIGLLGGLRNLVGEEVLIRLGVQALLMFHLRGKRWAPALAILGSALFFEVWHSSLIHFYFINFSASLAWGWAYHRYGYETAAVAHCLADWFFVALAGSILVGVGI